MNFSQYWQVTDAVTQSLFIILLTMSIVSWITGILRLNASNKLRTNGSKLIRNIMNGKRSLLINLDASQRNIVIEQILLRTIARLRYSTEKGLPILGTTAAIAPFLGLFGTVWGIFHALRNIGESGQAGLSQVSGPVGEALIMTGLGLAVAIPAVVFLNVISRINRGVLHNANDTAHELLAESILEMKSIESDTDK